MKPCKKNFLINLLLLLITTVSAQSFMFYLNDTPLEDNAKIIVSHYDLYFSEGDITFLTLESELLLKNITNADIEATVTQTIIEEPLDGESGYLSFCLYDCTTGNANRTKSGLLKANSFNEGFHVNFYVQEGIYNCITVQYEVYRTSDLSKNDKKTVTVTYIYDHNSTNQPTVQLPHPEINIYQEGNQIRYAHKMDICRLEIYNLAGLRMAQYTLSSKGSFTLPENMSKGVYFFVFKTQNKPLTTRKIVIK